MSLNSSAVAIALTLFLLLVPKISKVNYSSIPAECNSRRILQDDTPTEAIRGYLLDPFIHAIELLRRAYRLKRFPRQAIYTIDALMHAISTLSEVSKVFETILDKPGGEPILTNDIFLAENLKR